MTKKKNFELNEDTLKEIDKTLEDLQEGKIETCAGVYLINRESQHKQFCHDVNARWQSSASSCDVMGLRTFKDLCREDKDKLLENANAAEWQLLESYGISNQGKPQPMLQNSMTGFVDNTLCSSGHYLLKGYSDASSFWGIPERTLKRYVQEGMPHRYLGRYIVFNVTSGTYWLREHGHLQSSWTPGNISNVSGGTNF
jgi:hypothetical protein